MAKLNEITKLLTVCQMKKTDLAQLLGISRQQLNNLEAGKRRMTEKYLEKIKMLENFYGDPEPLSLLLDYVRIRFETTNVDYILKNVLMINLDIIEPENYAFYGYEKHYAFGDVVIMFHEIDNKKGVLLELKGKGCRQFEQMLEAQNRSWCDFFQCAVKHEGKMKRIDIAIDDTVGILDIPYFISKHETEECDTLFKRYNTYASSEMKRGEDEEKLMGNTLYIGSKRSEIYFCLYEKDYERYVETGVLPTFHGVKNRFEIRLKNDRATNMIKAYIRRGNLESVAFDIINRYMAYRIAKDGVELKDCELDTRWQIFLGLGRQKLKLTTKPEPVTLEKTWKWINDQVAPTLKMLGTLDAIFGTERLNESIEDAVLQPVHEKRIATQLYEVEDVVTWLQ